MGCYRHTRCDIARALRIPSEQDKLCTPCLAAFRFLQKHFQITPVWENDWTISHLKCELKADHV